MSHVQIQHAHALSHAEARHKVDAIAVELARKHGIDYHWQDDCLAFRRPGLDGSIQLDEGKVTVSAQLGLLLLPLRERLAAEVETLLARHFPTQ